MTTVTTVARIYIPSPGQADGATRATTLGTALANTTLANEPRYSGRATSLPCVVLDRGTEIVVVSDNPQTTHAAVDAAQDAMLGDDIPATVARITDVAGQVTTHTNAANPHGITAAAIGAAATSHSHVDADIPAAIARDAEVAAAYAVVAHNHDPAYATLAHTHAAPTAGAIRKTGAQTMTATAQTAVTDMSFAAAANATYYFEMDIVIPTSSGTAPTSAWGFTGPASPTAVALTMTQDTSTSVQVDAALTAFGNFAAGAQVAATGAHFTGVIQTAAGAGTVQLTCARAGTTPSMVVAAGCTGMWIRVA